MNGFGADLWPIRLPTNVHFGLNWDKNPGPVGASTSARALSCLAALRVNFVDRCLTVVAEDSLIANAALVGALQISRALTAAGSGLRVAAE